MDKKCATVGGRAGDPDSPYNKYCHILYTMDSTASGDDGIREIPWLALYWLCGKYSRDSSIPHLNGQASNNITSHSKRAVTTAVIVSFGGIGGIVATTIYRQQDFPRYIPGIITTIALQILLLVMLGVMTVHFWYENKKVKSKGDIGGFVYML
ncbi:hypothetical protein EDD18DRAFT_1108498 [Armillaria luteobubalina]|uniref:Uncharacterized protein n=1 Tax=Armillaria luteobubalina TaxID=153913 RepID=A0AA39PZH0_9AGAR|nr:hypothetical protein EDD18DRAFT_1108498 [Armillaria luteobubalina]